MNIVQETFAEVFALELLVQQMFISCNEPEYRALMAISVRQYMREEVYNPSDSVRSGAVTAQHVGFGGQFRGCSPPRPCMGQPGLAAVWRLTTFALSLTAEKPILL